MKWLTDEIWLVVLHQISYHNSRKSQHYPSDWQVINVLLHWYLNAQKKIIFLVVVVGLEGVTFITNQFQLHNIDLHYFVIV